MKDRIYVTGLEAVGICGVLPEERERAQPFRIDLVAEVDLAAAGASDQLADTIDYGTMATLAAQVVEASRFQLVEALAQAIGEVCLAVDPAIARLEVTVTKLRPPLALHLDSVGVRRVLER